MFQILKKLLKLFYLSARSLTDSRCFLIVTFGSGLIGFGGF